MTTNILLRVQLQTVSCVVCLSSADCFTPFASTVGCHQHPSPLRVPCRFNPLNRQFSFNIAGGVLLGEGSSPYFCDIEVNFCRTERKIVCGPTVGRSWDGWLVGGHVTALSELWKMQNTSWAQISTPLRQNNSGVGAGRGGGVDLADLLLSSSEMAAFDMQRLYPTSPSATTLSDGAAEAERKQNGIFTLPFFWR